MKLIEFKEHLQNIDRLSFRLPNGEAVPSHFHVTEVGKVSKHFIDCGGTERHETVISLQLWNANDYDHRLHPEKLINILDLSIEKLGLGNDTVEVDFQAESIQRYALEFKDKEFLLQSKFTDCLAKDACGIDQVDIKSRMTKKSENSCCSSSECC